MSKRAEYILFVLLPVVLLWLLLLLFPAGLSLSERLGIGALFSVVFAPLMYLRVRN